MSAGALVGATMASVVTDFTDWLDEIAGQWWFLLVILAVAFLDSIIPVVPSETTVIIGGVAAGLGDQSLPLVILVGAVGAFLGDNSAYLIGRRASNRIERFAATRPKTADRLAWADAQIRKRGGLLLITARFIPGGRTALTVSSGITHQPHGWFAGWVAVAAVIWASYASLLGYVGGRTFQDNHTVAFLVAFGTALLATVLIELVRHRLEKRRAGASAIVDAFADTVDEIRDDEPSDAR
jgi:membrane protein DedA with SNARE-associated domain